MVAVPNAPLRLLPEGSRAPSTMRETRLHSGLAQRHSHIKCRLYLDTRGPLHFSVFGSYFIENPSPRRGSVEILEGFPRPVGAVVNLHLVFHRFHQRRHSL